MKIFVPLIAMVILFLSCKKNTDEDKNNTDYVDNNSIIKVSGGTYNSLLLKQDASVWQMTDYDITNPGYPTGNSSIVIKKVMDNVKEMSAGVGLSFILKN